MFQVKERVCKSTESRVSMTGLGFMQWKLNSIIKVENSLKDNKRREAVKGEKTSAIGLDFWVERTVQQLVAYRQP